MKAYNTNSDVQIHGKILAKDMWKGSKTNISQIK